MELTITFFIKFYLLVHFVLALLGILLGIFPLNGYFDRYPIFNFFSKGLYFRLLSYNYPIRRDDYKEQ